MSNNIYGLIDPRRPDWVMYVGKGLEQRAKSHWKGFLRNGWAQNALLRRWFEQLKADNVIPDFIFLEEDVSNWQEAEKDWIAAWRKVNSQLCNVADGGNQWPQNASKLGGIAAGPTTRKTGGGLAIAWEIHREAMLKTVIISSAKGRKRTLELYPDHQSKAGKIGWKKSRENNLDKISEWGRKGGLGGGGQLACLRDPTLARRRGILGTHNRWHVARGIIKKECSLCSTPS